MSPYRYVSVSVCRPQFLFPKGRHHVQNLCGKLSLTTSRIGLLTALEAQVETN